MSSRPVELPPTRTHQLGDGPLVGTVYSCLDADGLTLYVGQSVRLVKRFNTHRCRAPWWSQVARIELFEVRDDRTLDEVERQVIADTRPLHNRLHNPDWEWSYAARMWIPVGTRPDPDRVAIICRDRSLSQIQKYMSGGSPDSVYRLNGFADADIAALRAGTVKFADITPTPTPADRCDCRACVDFDRSRGADIIPIRAAS